MTVKQSLVSLLAIVPVTVIRGWAIKTLWAWFVVPVFGCPGLALLSGIGFSLLLSATQPTSGGSKDEEILKKSTGYQVALMLATSILFNLSLVGLGFVLHLFM